MNFKIKDNFLCVFLTLTSFLELPNPEKQYFLEHLKQTSKATQEQKTCDERPY